MSSSCTIRKETAKIFSKYTNQIYLANLEICEKDICRFPQFKYNKLTIPYPSISKFALRKNQTRYVYDINENRLIDIFFSGNTRKWNGHRAFIFENSKVKTNVSFSEFSPMYNTTKKEGILSVIYDLGI